MNPAMNDRDQPGSNSPVADSSAPTPVGVASDPVALLDNVPLSDSEAGYVEAARAGNTLRGYRSDWSEFVSWCVQNDHDETPLPASPEVISGYLSELARAGAKVGTLSRRLSAIRFIHQLHNRPDPTRNARVVAVWEGIRRTHGTPPDQSHPLMPPDLFDVLDACPTTKVWKTKGRPDERDLAGARDRALLLIGFVAALRRSELAVIQVEDLDEHANGLVISLPRSKTNQTGQQAELAVLPRAGNPDRCPITALQRWRQLADITDGPLLRPVLKSNKAADRGLNSGSINPLVQTAIRRAGIIADGYSAHSLRAGFVTYAHLRGATDRAIAHQTRHRSLATLTDYVRIHQAWTDNAATTLGL